MRYHRMKHRINLFFLSILVLFISLDVSAQKITSWDSVNFSGVKMRSVGPAFMTGRIADVAQSFADLG